VIGEGLAPVRGTRWMLDAILTATLAEAKRPVRPRR
jgi:hypothetical protein